MYFKIECDYKTSGKAGAGKMFQVAGLYDYHDLDFTHLIDQGKHYSSLNDVRNDLAEKISVAKDSIDFHEV
jgi:type I restriction enzyme S subunit